MAPSQRLCQSAGRGNALFRKNDIQAPCGRPLPAEQRYCPVPTPIHFPAQKKPETDVGKRVFLPHPEHPILDGNPLPRPGRSGTACPFRKKPPFSNLLLPAEGEKTVSPASSGHDPPETATATTLFPLFQKQKGRTALFQQAQYMPARPDEFLFAGIDKLGLLDDAAVILGAVFTVFFPDGD